MAVISRPKVNALSTALPMSNLAPEVGVTGRWLSAIGTASMPSGMFTANSHGQLPTDRMPAATVGPSAEAIEPMVAFSPTPRPIQRRG